MGSGRIKIITTEYKVKIHIVITAAMMVFIFIQSALPGPVSGAESGMIVRILQHFIEADHDILTLAVRKTAHFTEYMILGICLTVNMRDMGMRHDLGIRYRSNDRDGADHSGKVEPRDEHIGELTGSMAIKYFALAWLFGTLYAVTDEIHQAFVPERACTIMDVGIDSAGVALGVIIAGAVFRMHGSGDRSQHEMSS